MALPSVLVWYLFQMQAADESLVLEQRRSRAAEAPYSVGVAIEDPLPTLLKELLVTNPVVLVVLGCCAAIPILLSNAMVTLKTERGRMAQTHLTLTYLPMVLFQLGFLFVLSTVDFLDLPAFYLTGGVYLVSAPCLLTWFASPDAKNMEDMTRRDEQEAQKAYEAFTKETKDSVAAKNTEIVTKSEEKAKAEGALVEAKEERESVLLELEQLSNYNAELHQSCDFTTKNFELRQTARAEEIEALRQAKAILSGSDFSVEV
ncbi:unnamed protein product [Prorocentrum cordatum]|uniref:Uncharacterized protein n=1 Tax=Prorocentrum cordatum TaxID=2364126 RepID=A0ABN9XYN6_9DINO|nr:unnamed protein product [Polarella glacialis]